jgi:hypothetical protein
MRSSSAAEIIGLARQESAERGRGGGENGRASSCLEVVWEHQRKRPGSSSYAKEFLLDSDRPAWSAGVGGVVPCAPLAKLQLTEDGSVPWVRTGTCARAQASMPGLDLLCRALSCATPSSCCDVCAPSAWPHVIIVGALIVHHRHRRPGRAGAGPRSGWRTSSRARRIARAGPTRRVSTRRWR